MQKRLEKSKDEQDTFFEELGAKGRREEGALYKSHD